MADDQDPSNDVNDDGGEFDYEELTTAVPAPGPVAVQTTTASLVDGDYDDDEPIEDYVVNLVVNEKPDGLPSGLVDVVTDRYGNTIYDSLNTVSTTIYDELNGNGTALTGGKKGWFGWSTAKLLLVGLIALCILGIILAAIFFVISKKFKKNQHTTTTGSTTTTKAAVTKGISPDPKYQPVPNV